MEPGDSSGLHMITILKGGARPYRAEPGLESMRV
jgi:hypothetical protein